MAAGAWGFVAATVQGQGVFVLFLLTAWLCVAGARPVYGFLKMMVVLALPIVLLNGYTVPGVYIMQNTWFPTREGMVLGGQMWLLLTGLALNSLFFLQNVPQSQWQQLAARSPVAKAYVAALVQTLGWLSQFKTLLAAKSHKTVPEKLHLLLATPTPQRQRPATTSAYPWVLLLGLALLMAHMH